MIQQPQGIRQLTALLVLAIVTTASGLPHWHIAPLDTSGSSDVLLGSSVGSAVLLASASDADLLECAACVLQRILTQASTESTEAPPQPGLQAEVEPALERPVSTPHLRFTDPRGPPSA